MIGKSLLKLYLSKRFYMIAFAIIIGLSIKNKNRLIRLVKPGEKKIRYRLNCDKSCMIISLCSYKHILFLYIET